MCVCVGERERDNPIYIYVIVVYMLLLIIYCSILNGSLWLNCQQRVGSVVRAENRVGTNRFDQFGSGCIRVSVDVMNSYVICPIQRRFISNYNLFT